MVPQTTLLVSSFYYISVLILVYVSSNYFSCVFDTARCVRGEVWPHMSGVAAYECRHMTTSYRLLLLSEHASHSSLNIGTDTHELRMTALLLLH